MPHGVQNVQAIANLGLDASHGGAPSRRFAAYPRLFQCAGHWQCGSDSKTEESDL